MHILVNFLFYLFYFGYIFLILPVSTWLLINAPTWVGQCIAVIGFLFIPLPFLLKRAIQQRHQKRWRNSVIFGSWLIGSLLIIIFATTSSGHPVADSPVHHRYAQPATFSRFNLANIIPESEQVNLGYLLMPFLDPILTHHQADRVAIFTMDIYHDMEQDDNFHELGSVMGLAYRELLGLPFDVGHYYLYVPEHAPGETLPAIVFLHGSAGNFKSYSWVWSKLAERERFVVIAPSYGFGNWNEDSIDSVLNALIDAQTVVDIDDQQIFLAGLSNGGLGVSHVANHSPDLFQGLIFISPVMANNIVDHPSFQSKWAGRPVLVVTGENDQRIPLDYVMNRVDAMEQAQIDVNSVIFQGEDHFLFYAQAEEVMDKVAEWLPEMGAP